VVGISGQAVNKSLHWVAALGHWVMAVVDAGQTVNFRGHWVATCGHSVWVDEPGQVVGMTGQTVILAGQLVN
jgi:hypothetical protein